jgi:hypothetical protein
MLVDSASNSTEISHSSQIEIHFKVPPVSQDMEVVAGEKARY